MLQDPQQNHSGGIDVCNVSRKDPKKANFFTSVDNPHRTIMALSDTTTDQVLVGTLQASRNPAYPNNAGMFMLSTLLQGAMV